MHQVPKYSRAIATSTIQRLSYIYEVGEIKKTDDSSEPLDASGVK